jgi:hypothetical protein
MADALELGLTVADFWDMTPRAIYLLRDERLRRLEGRVKAKESGAKPKGQRLSYLPRP